MKKINLLFSTIFCSLIIFTACKKEQDPTPDLNPDAPVVTSTMTTSNGGNTGTALASLDVSTSTGTAKIKLDVTSTVDLDKIFIMKSEDNGTLVAQTFSTITTGGITFTGGSSNYSFSIPGTTKTFVLEIPVSVRTTSAAVTDVYYIWITNGAGDFVKPTKNTVLGPAIVTLKYGSGASTASYSTGTASLGDQTATPGSLLVTSGQIAALLTADYIDAPQSADISLSALDGTGATKTNNSGILWLISPSLRAGLGYAGCASCGAGGTSVAEPTSGTGANITYIATYSGSFDNATGADLTALSVGTATKAQITAVGNVFMFQTAKNKKGLIKVTALTATNGSPGTATVSIKVLN
jgi:hypothetical protein